MEFVFSEVNFPFAVALTLMLIIALMEGVLLIIGAGLSNFIDSLLPDIEIDADIPQTGISRFLSWLRFGRLPALILLVILLTAFGVSGIVMQSLLNSVLGVMMPAVIAIVPALFIALSITRFTAGLMERFLAKDETEAIRTTDFIGHVATVTIGMAVKGSPAEARFQDRFGTTHYLMVEPDGAGEFHQGDSLLLVAKEGSIYLGISPSNNNLKEPGNTL